MSKKKVDLNIYKSSDRGGQPRFLVRVKDVNGNWYPQKTFSNLALAKRYRSELLGYRDTCKRAPAMRQPDMNFGEYWSIWAQECRGRCSDGWKLSQEQMARDHILPSWKGQALNEITSRDVAILMLKLEEKGLGAQTRKHAFSLISRMFFDAVDHFEYIAASPVRRKHKPKVTLKERPFLPPADLLKLLARARSHYLGPAIWLGGLVGLRSEAIIALQWDSIDFEKNEILIKQGWKRKVRRIDPFPKGKTWERIPMPQSLADYLSERKSQSTSITDFVAPSREGKMLDYQKFLCGLKSLCKEVGVAIISPHGLRHSTSELYVESAGASIEDVRRLLCQKDLSTTARYMHRTDARLASLARAVDLHLETSELKIPPRLRVVQ